MAKDKQEDTQVNEAAFLKALNKSKAAAKAAAKADRPTGLLDDAAILARLGLKEANDAVTLNCRVSKVQMGFAKKDTARPYFRFAYVLTENSPETGKGKGMIVSNYHELTEAEKDGEVWRTEEDAYEKMYFEFQGLGETTKDWADPLAEAMAAAKRQTKNKTEIQIRFSAYERNNGTLGLNISVVNVLNNDDLGDDTEDADDDTDESEDEGNVPLSEWVGGWVKWEDADGAVEFLVDNYDEDADTFTGTDEDGEEWGPAPTSACEWCDNQRDE